MWGAMTKYAAVTTMSKANFDQYGEKFLETYLTHWDIPLYVYWEGSDYPTTPDGKLKWRNLDQDQDRAIFLAKYGDKVSKDYRKNAVKFCHKVFALTDPKRIDKSSDITWIWLDADIESFAEVDKDWLDELCPEGFVGSYLGRADWHHSECGFMSFNMDEGAVAILQGWREVYTSGQLFRLGEWHDSYVFDTLRKGWWFDISAGVPGMHVFDDSYLGTRLTHAKGEFRKSGELPENAPPGYLSEKERAESKTVAQMDGQHVLVKTKNCVPDKKIRANIAFAASTVSSERYLPQCATDYDSVAVVVSAGPSLEGSLEHIANLAARPGHYVIAVKHAVKTLREHGIPVWGVILLDPRPHVADFVDVDDKKVKYFVSSMSHPDTIELLDEHALDYWVYHAHVGAGEEKVIAEQIGKDQFMVSGGCSTALRGLGVLRVIGFRRFRLFAYDLCYPSPEEKSGNAFKNTQYMTVTVEGREFHTDAEKIAQVQDFKNLLVSMPEVEVECYGPGIVPHYWNCNREIRPHFEDALKLPVDAQMAAE